MRSNTLPILDVTGGPTQRGREQGEGAKEMIHIALERYREILPQASHCSWEDVLNKAHTFFPPTQAAFPEFIQELEGVAEGAHAPFEDIWVLNCYQELLEIGPRPPSCTSLAVGMNHTTNNHIYLAHNEDWLSADRDTVYLVRVKPQDGPAFLGMTYGPLLVNIGFNENGIGVAINSVYASDARVGVPRVVYSRAVLKARTIEDALHACHPQKRAGGYHYLLADHHGNLYSIETSARQHTAVLGETGWLVHTNHYLSADLKILEPKRDLNNSHLRFKRAQRLLTSHLGSINPEVIQMLLRDHTNYPDSICEHEDPTIPAHNRSQTLVSLIMDLSERMMWVAPGPSCQGTYMPYTL